MPDDTLIPTVIRFKKKTMEDLKELFPHYDRAQVVRQMVEGYIRTMKLERQSPK